MKVLKIFSDRKYLPPGKGHFAMLNPFWGKAPEDPDNPNAGRFDKYTEVGKRFFKMTSLSEADFAVLPVTWERLKTRKEVKIARQLGIDAGKAGKQVIIFFWNELEEEIPFENAIFFKTSLYRSRRKPNEFAFPAWIVDLVEKYFNGKLTIRKKGRKPIVGFCGHLGRSKLPLTWKIKNSLREAASFVGLKSRREPLSTILRGNIVRTRAVQALLDNNLVQTNFIIRDRYFAGAALPDGVVKGDLMQKVRMEYLQNMLDSDYVLCARGAGNYSFRLYETLCCGRIPVFIDTDCVLPYDFEIDWKKYCVWVDESEIPMIGEKILDFHSSLSPQDFIDLQYQCRRLWKEWLSPEGFFAHFYRHFFKK